MKTLGIETSGDVSSVALVEDGGVLGEHVFPARMSLCQTLAGHVQAVVGANVVSAEAVDQIAVSLGPGSFTGLRMGVALAKAMAHASGLPLIGVPTPEVLAWPLLAVAGTRVCVLQHARREDVYWSLFRPARPFELDDPPPDVRLESVEAVAQELAAEAGPVLVVGDGGERHAAALHAALGERLTLAPPPLNLPRASTVAHLAQGRPARPDAPGVHGVRPIYVLTSQAERARGVDLGLG